VQGKCAWLRRKTRERNDRVSEDTLVELSD
jgi:hypothetical protein